MWTSDRGVHVAGGRLMPETTRMRRKSWSADMLEGFKVACVDGKSG